ncbi:hypothetical protein BC567DRAFT_52767 [Phyllosticta citribraziliensis]
MLHRLVASAPAFLHRPRYAKQRIDSSLVRQGPTLDEKEAHQRCSGCILPRCGARPQADYGLVHAGPLNAFDLTQSYNDRDVSVTKDVRNHLPAIRRGRKRKKSTLRNPACPNSHSSAKITLCTARWFQDKPLLPPAMPHSSLIGAVTAGLDVYGPGLFQRLRQGSIPPYTYRTAPAASSWICGPRRDP